jgi:hypothetical protein
MKGLLFYIHTGCTAHSLSQAEAKEEESKSLARERADETRREEIAGAKTHSGGSQLL